MTIRKNPNHREIIKNMVFKKVQYNNSVLKMP